ncbi:glycosyltransferase family 2 protein [Priestia flexa]|uniref:glycosyltransferase family 2 protein n=1 Tax=Priestia flexa TaxID=86664 RepID=UPI0004734BD1|nr:glycosyltransferase [Priestia flexa]
MIKVSVILPLYNVEKYIKKCLDSILKQTLKDIEVIIVNDGSPDNSRLIASKYAEIDSRVRIIDKENGGLSSARNQGLDAAAGEYVVFIDSDDWVEENMLEVMYSQAKKEKADLSICNYNKVFNAYKEKNYLSIKDEIIRVKDLGLKDYLYNYYFGYVHGDEVWNKMYKNSIIKQNNIRFEKNSEVFSEDKLFNFYFLLHVETITTIEKSFYNYLQRTGSLMNASKPKLINQYINLMEKLLLYSKDKDQYKHIVGIYPLVCFSLLSSAIDHQLQNGVKLNCLKNLIKQASNSNIRSYMFKLSVSAETHKYCKKHTFFKEVYVRVFGLLYYFKAYSTLSAIKYLIYKLR